jgi:hypothetical protein
MGDAAIKRLAYGARLLVGLATAGRDLTPVVPKVKPKPCAKMAAAAADQGQ